MSSREFRGEEQEMGVEATAAEKDALGTRKEAGREGCVSSFDGGRSDETQETAAECERKQVEGELLGLDGTQESIKYRQVDTGGRDTLLWQIGETLSKEARVWSGIGRRKRWTGGMVMRLTVEIM